MHTYTKTTFNTKDHLLNTISVVGTFHKSSQQSRHAGGAIPVLSVPLLEVEQLPGIRAAGPSLSATRAY